MICTIRRRLAILFLSAAVVIASVLAWVLPKPALYRVTILPALSPALGGQLTQAHALNDMGQVVGVACTAILQGHLFLWDRKDGVRDLGLVNGIVALDNDGRICGTMPTDPNHEQAFLWEPGKGPTMLGTLGYVQSKALAMNNHGQVVGICETNASIGNRVSCVFLWDKAAGMKEVKAGGGSPWPESINDAGQILVESPPRWFLLDPNGATTSLDGVSRTWEPRSVSNSSCVVGIDAANHRLVLFQTQGKVRYLPSGSGNLLYVTRLNDRNQIAYTVWFGHSWWQNLMARIHGSRGAADEVASYLWDPVRGRVPLDKYVRGMKQFSVEDLNNNGAILGTAQMKDGMWRAVLLEPIPERWRK